MVSTCRHSVTGVGNIVKYFACGNSRTAKSKISVIPAEAGIQTNDVYTASLDSGLRRNDGVLANFDGLTNKSPR